MVTGYQVPVNGNRVQGYASDITLFHNNRFCFGGTGLFYERFTGMQLIYVRFLDRKNRLIKQWLGWERADLILKKIQPPRVRNKKFYHFIPYFSGNQLFKLNLQPQKRCEAIKNSQKASFFNPGTLKFGWWRSPVAHLYGVQGVAGSNPVHPTQLDKAAEMLPCLFLSSSVMLFSRAIGSNSEFTLEVRNASFSRL